MTHTPTLTPFARRIFSMVMRTLMLSNMPRAFALMMAVATALLSMPAPASAAKGYTPPPSARPAFKASAGPRTTPTVRPSQPSQPMRSPIPRSVRVEKPLPDLKGVKISRKGTILSKGRVYPARVGKGVAVSKDGKGIVFKRLPGGRVAERVSLWRIGRSDHAKHRGATVIRPEMQHPTHQTQPANPRAHERSASLAKSDPARHIETRRASMEDVFGPSRKATVRDQFEHAHDHGVVVNSARGRRVGDGSALE